MNREDISYGCQQDHLKVMKDPTEMVKSRSNMAVTVAGLIKSRRSILCPLIMVSSNTWSTS